jgi:hypothetical protein
MANPKNESVTDNIGRGRYIINVRLGRRAMDRILEECRRIAKARGWELDPHNARADIAEAIVQSMVDWHALGPNPIGVTTFAYNIARRLRKRKTAKRAGRKRGGPDTTA